MKLTVSRNKISGEVSAPGSKSHTIRALAFALLAKNASVIRNPLIASDTISALTAASSLGAWVQRSAGDDAWKIYGTGGSILDPAGVLDMGNSGTATRLFCGIASLCTQRIRFDGDSSLRSRPMAPLLDALSGLGVLSGSTDGKAPFWVHGPALGGETTVNGKSSQFLSALLIMAPLCRKDTIIHVENLNEKPYVDMTLEWLRNLQVQFKMKDDYSLFEIYGNQHYKPFRTQIPGDFSTAAFPAVAGLVTNGKVTIKNLNFDDPQGDKKLFDYLELMGAKVARGNNSVTVSRAFDKLQPVELDLNATPDALPVLAVAAACAGGISVFKNVAQARIKETDRIHCMKVELGKMGIMVEEFEDGMAVTGGKIHSAAVNSYGDHRIAMSLAVAGLAASDNGSTVIDGAEAAAVTYPQFVEDFRRLGAVLYEN